jgi:lipopolysaccharide transport system permease protein
MNPHLKHNATPYTIFASVWSNRQLISQLTKREVVGRYRGSIMGFAWSFLNPILMLAVYTLFFTVVFKARWGDGVAVGEKNHADFAIVLFAGLIVHGLFAECLNRAPGLIIQNVNYVKKVVFPLEILPWVTAISALFHAGISLMVLLSAQLIISHSLPWTAILFPLVIAPFVFIILGLAWFLSAFGVYVRDSVHVIGMLTSVMLFMSPVFYPVSSLPTPIQPWLMLNPLTFIIEQARNVLIYTKQPDWQGLVVYLIISLVVAWLGFWWFQKARKGFADVL